MKKSDLIALLATYPDDMEVKVVCDHFVRPVTAVSEIVDLDTNIVSIEIVAEDKPDLSIVAQEAAEGMYRNNPYIVGRRRPDAPPDPVVTPERLEEIRQSVREYLP